MSATKSPQNQQTSKSARVSSVTGLALVWRAAAVIVLRALALAACALILTQLMPDSIAAERGADVVPLWISIGLVVGLFTVVLAAWRLDPGHWTVSVAELVIAAGLLVATWLVDNDSEVFWQAVPLLASVWLAFAAVDLARTTPR